MVSRLTRPRWALPGLGLLGVVPYLYALSLGDLRRETPGFLVAYGFAFILYWAAVAIVLRAPPAFHQGRRWGWEWGVLFAAPILYSLILLFSTPSLSDDMFRYVWDGRVQDAGISPYTYSPDAKELAELRDPTIWRHINRKWAVTVYPPGAEMAWSLQWQLFPDSIEAFASDVIPAMS